MPAGETRYACLARLLATPLKREGAANLGAGLSTPLYLGTYLAIYSPGIEGGTIIIGVGVEFSIYYVGRMDELRSTN